MGCPVGPLEILIKISFDKYIYRLVLIVNQLFTIVPYLEISLLVTDHKSWAFFIQKALSLNDL